MLRPRVASLCVLLITFVSLSGCGGDNPTQPTLSSVNFTPKMILEISGHDLRFSLGPRQDPDVSTNNPTVPPGTVIAVVNRGPAIHRLQFGIILDTGIMRSGEDTTIVLTNNDPADKRIEITDPTDAQVHGAIIVRPKPPAT